MSLHKSMGPMAAMIACWIFISGCGSTKPVVTTGKSAGEQLIELNDAKEKGLIDKREYERMRRRIVREND